MGIGYALGNAIMVIAPDGIIIVDVTESSMAAKEILAEFRKITKKPIKAIIYTHHHTDHIGGVGVSFSTIVLISIHRTTKKPLAALFLLACLRMRRIICLTVLKYMYM